MSMLVDIEKSGLQSFINDKALAKQLLPGHFVRNRAILYAR